MVIVNNTWFMMVIRANLKDCLETQTLYVKKLSDSDDNYDFKLKCGQLYKQFH